MQDIKNIRILEQPFGDIGCEAGKFQFRAVDQVTDGKQTAQIDGAIHLIKIIGL